MFQFTDTLSKPSGKLHRQRCDRVCTYFLRWTRMVSENTRWTGSVCELTRHLAAGNDQVELYALGLPEAEPNSPVRLTNLASRIVHYGNGFGLLAAIFEQTSSQTRCYKSAFCPVQPTFIADFARWGAITFTFHGPGH